MAAIISMADIEARARALGIDLSAVNLDSITLPSGEDFGIKSDDEDDLYHEEALEMKFGFGNVIVVDNLPVVPPEKYKKLEGVIRKKYSQIEVIREGGLSMPVNPETKKTLGYCFIEYNTAQENLQKWLTDKKVRDQFVIRAGPFTEVFWNDPRQMMPEFVYRRQYWTESFVQWSPLGTYLATVHRQGVALWGGANTFNRLMGFAHPQVKLIDFSPGEKYIVTYSSHEPSNPRDTHRVVLNFFDLRTGKLMRNFKGNADDFASGSSNVTGVSWPVFRWGGGREDKYFARLGKNLISVYETDTFTLMDKKSLKVENVADFTWSPTDPIIAFFVPELGGGNQPARVGLIHIPSKEEMRQKNLFNVSDIKMYWQNNGEYLAVKVDRHTKTKKNITTGFELFRIKERDIPIEVLELENKNDKIISFEWEPKGHRFAVIHGDAPRPDISFYSMRTTQNAGRVSKLATLKSKQANALYWSPAGRFIVLAGLKGFNGQLEFYNVDDLETMATGEHFMATNIDWDPSGRYCATSVTSVHEMENGFHIWSFIGKLLYRIPKDHFYQFLWRPRPPSLLSPEKEEEILKNLNKYIKKYEAEDHNVSLQLNEQDMKKIKMVDEKWEQWAAEDHDVSLQLNEQDMKKIKMVDEEWEQWAAEDHDVSLQLNEHNIKKIKMVDEEWEQWATHLKKLHEEKKVVQACSSRQRGQRRRRR